MRNNILICCFVFCLCACREKYDFPVRTSDVSSLVVEGILNVGGPTNIKLSKVLKVSDKSGLKPELKASVIVEGRDNVRHGLIENGNGNYSTGQLNIQAGKEYRLLIRTSDGRNYASDFVLAKQTPPIDSIQWLRNDGVSLWVHTHDPANSSRYYRWEYEETWEINSEFDAVYKWTGGSTIISVPQGAGTFRCWKYENSSRIMVGSSAHLQSDVIYQYPLLVIPDKSEKLGIRYSILVRQNVLSKGGYEFLEAMRKNTELQGGIFDPQPTEIKGNIRNVNDANELVVGYVDVSNVVQKRIFIDYQWRYGLGCEVVRVSDDPTAIWDATLTKELLPFDKDGAMYMMAHKTCIDCTLRGGSLSKPSYW